MRSRDADICISKTIWTKAVTSIWNDPDLNSGSTRCKSLWLKSLHNLIMESVPFTFLIFYPNIFQHGYSFPFQVQTSFFYTWTFCILFCCQKTEECVINALVPALFVKHQWLNPSVLISCSHVKKKKEIIPSSVKSWHIWGSPFPNHHVTSSRTDTKHYFFSFFSCATTWHLLQRKY